MEDADFPLHWHAPGEIISPIEGTYTVTIAGKTVTLQPHDVLIIASGELHSIRAPKTGERYIMNYSVSYFHQIQDMAELFNTFYPFRPVSYTHLVARMVKTEMGIHCYQKKRKWYWSVQPEEGAMNGSQV